MSQVIFLSAVLLMAGGVFTGANKLEKLSKAANKCMEGTTTTKELLDNLFKNNMNMAEPEYSTKCYLKCIMQEMGAMKSDGAIELDASHQHFSECASQATEDDMCNRAYNFQLCVHAQNPEIPIY